MRKMRKKSVFIIVWIVAATFFFRCGEESPTPPAQPQKAGTGSAATQGGNPPLPTPQPSFPTSSKPWPFIEEEPQDEELARNLTAKNYALIFDGSGSMSESGCSDGLTKIDAAKRAVAEWSKSVPEDANLALVAFHQGKWSLLPLAGGQRTEFINLVQNMIAGGTTPLAEAFEKAYKALTVRGQAQLGYGNYTIVVVTDGQANNIRTLNQWVKHILANSPLNIYTIGFCIGNDHSLNQPGQTVYKPANNPEELRESLKEVLAEAETFDDSDFKE